MLRNITSGGFPTKVIALGIGDNIDEDELGTIATDPDYSNVVLVDDFNSLTNVQTQLTTAICEGFICDHQYFPNNSGL